MTNKFLVIFLFIVLYATNGFAQFWTEADEDLIYRRESVYGINFNTNGGLIGGVSFKHARVINKFMFHSFSIEAVNVKHPKESRYQNISTGSSYIAGKSNYLYVLRPQYGRELVLFQKAKEQGIQVNFIPAIGPTLGIVAPYLIRYEYLNGRVATEPYDSNVHQLSNILGTGSFTESLSQASIVPGLSVKASVTFEFGTFKNNVTGFEAGFMVDGFTKEIIIMEEADNRQVYTSAFLTFFYGTRK